ncbi:DUF4089 domain-containing protein [Anabaena sp. FACHB-1237]|uniref:DUF4089 domain-containing protein n=1 Tax=Anabaena sp. FACHB-1237 TaxID=2692769 RepID=UPI001681BBF9|nr:DUF4089 domain-containing protein [Anabaena sp. FACHB-1237]MBD2137203.1 DUF4089 domain-containing protein [Anabaena sp. FACHB-1237]
MDNQDCNSQFSHQKDTIEYIKIISTLLNLPINDEYQNGVVANFERIKSIAEVVNNFTVPEEINIAPIFEP